MPTNAQVSKWGNSLAVRIPQGIAKDARLAEGNRVTLKLANDGSIVLRSTRPKYDLKKLVSQITPKNRPCEIEWGAAVGKELW